jgi:putative nucleotidyltransferase with HDIG domain
MEQVQDKIERLYSLLIVIRKINKALLMVKSEPELFQQICDLLTELEDIGFVWIGLLEKGSFDVKLVAQAGFDEGYLSSLQVTWDDSVNGSGPTGMAIKSAQPYIVEDMVDDPQYRLWKANGPKRGYGSCIALPLIHKGDVIGALNAYSMMKGAFGEEEVDFLVEVAGDIAVGIRSLRLEQELQRSLERLQKVHDQTVAAIAFMTEMRDPYTSGHQHRVARLACDIAQEMGLSDDQVTGTFVAGILHDIGKIRIPAEILAKPDGLNEFEFGLLQTHSQIGHDILTRIDFPWPIAQIVLQHHERMNGSGYPSGASGEDIRVEAKILGVADVVEAMSSHRPYRAALGLEHALEEISRNKGVLYDSAVADACLNVFALNEIEW